MVLPCRNVIPNKYENIHLGNLKVKKGGIWQILKKIKKTKTHCFPLWYKESIKNRNKHRRMVKIKWETQDYLTVLLAVFLAHMETEETMSQRQIYFLGMVAPYKKKKKQSH